MDKVSMFCHVKPSQVVGVHNVASTYHVPLLLREQGLITYLTERLNLPSIDVGVKGKQRGDSLLGRWRELTGGYVVIKVAPPITPRGSCSADLEGFASRHDRLFDSVNIVLVGKYTSMQDSYMSVVKSLEHASMRCGRKLNLQVRRPARLRPLVI